MSIRPIIQRLRETKVLENYSFMTALNVLGALISFFIYPYVVHVTGREAFGVYPYALAWVAYFQLLIDFGLEAPAAKAIVEHADDKEQKEYILSSVFTAKLLLFIGSTLLFSVLLFTVSDMRDNSAIFIFAYLQTLVSLLYPYWYFQGMRNMRVVTYINLACRLAAVPLILLFVKAPEHVWIYAAIISLTSIAGALAAWLYITIHDRLRIRLVSLKALRTWFSDGAPFMMTQIAGLLKEGLMTILIRHFFGYADVTLFDIAKKIVSIPRMFTQNINNALFPEVISNAAPQRVRRVLLYERLIGIGISIAIVALAYPVILWMFGTDSMGAYPLSAIYSLTIYTWLVAGAYLQFVFIPHHRYYHVTINQVVALISCLLFSAIGLLAWKNILVIAMALTLSGFVEIVYCRIICKKEQLL